MATSLKRNEQRCCQQLEKNSSDFGSGQIHIWHTLISCCSVCTIHVV